jgi:hypothetical protein
LCCVVLCCVVLCCVVLCCVVLCCVVLCCVVVLSSACLCVCLFVSFLLCFLVRLDSFGHRSDDTKLVWRTVRSD